LRKIFAISSSWDGRPFGHNRRGSKMGGCAPFGEVLGPHLSQCRLGRRLPSYQVASWSIMPFGHIRHGPKIGGLCPFGEGELGLHLTQCGRGQGLSPFQVSCWSIDLSNCLATIHQHHTDRQDRTDCERRANHFTNDRPKTTEAATADYYGCECMLCLHMLCRCACVSASNTARYLHLWKCQWR